MKRMLASALLLASVVALGFSAIGSNCALAQRGVCTQRGSLAACLACCKELGGGFRCNDACANTYGKK